MQTRGNFGMRKITDLVLIVLLCIPYGALATDVDPSSSGTQQKSIVLHEGLKAPFSGILMPFYDAAQIRAQLEEMPKLCEEKLRHNKAIFDIQLKNEQANFELKNNFMEAQLLTSEKDVGYYRDKSAGSWYESGALWFVTGFVLGSLAVVGTMYIIE